MFKFAFPMAMLLVAFALAASGRAASKTIDVPKSFEEKEKIAKDMKKIAKQLDVKCEYCHSDAERGLKEGDYTLLTKEGEYAHEVMFPISKEFKVQCSFCHLGGADLTPPGERSHKDMKFMSRYKKKHKKALQCATCHIPGEKGSEFSGLTKDARKLLATP